VPGRRLPGIPVRRIASMLLFERLRECLQSSGNRDQVHVIRHETVTQQGESAKLRILPQQLKISGTVRIAGQNDLSRIPPLRNMMGNVDDHDARQSSHSMKIAEVTWPADNDGVGFAFVIPRAGGNNRGTSRLSPCFLVKVGQPPRPVMKHIQFSISIIVVEG
jgi:hypothetical protein